MRIYQTKNGIFIQQANALYEINQTWDELINRPNLSGYLSDFIKQATPSASSLQEMELLPPIGSQEIWASGVTYYKSREARMEESKEAGGGSFYDRVYHADRPELFFKSSAARAVGSGQNVRIRKDSNWNVPEPELTLVINHRGQIIGYTIGNDMSSRDIEGENPLYLPQAKTYDKSAAIGPGVWVVQKPIDPETNISIEIIREEKQVFAGNIQLNQIKRSFKELVDYLFLELTFPVGAYLMTGTGIVPTNDFTLNIGDTIKITIDHIGTLENVVE